MLYPGTLFRVVLYPGTLFRVVLCPGTEFRVVLCPGTEFRGTAAKITKMDLNGLENMDTAIEKSNFRLNDHHFKHISDYEKLQHACFVRFVFSFFQL
ncbi:MAG: hypothetical protein Q7T20_08310 [Saprospiraceae bacterium]|nr:hypothetical protein [Saprospiraceae bacterium]